MVKRGLLRALKSLGLIAGLLTALPTGTEAHPPEPTEASHRVVRADDLFLTAPNGWHIYVNGRFGTRVSYPPDLFTPAEAPEAGDGRRFEGETAVIEVIGWVNDNGLTPQSLASHLVGAEGYGEVRQKEIQEARLVLSGQRSERVFYEEYLFQGGTVQAFAMEYPAALASGYDLLLDEIAASFVHGDGAVPGELAAAPPQGGCPNANGCSPPDLDRPLEGPVQFRPGGTALPPHARPLSPGELRILVWAPRGPGGKKLKTDDPEGKRLKALSGNRPGVARGPSGKKPKIKAPGRNKPKAGSRGRGKKR